MRYLLALVAAVVAALALGVAPAAATGTPSIDSYVCDPPGPDVGGVALRSASWGTTHDGVRHGIGDVWVVDLPAGRHTVSGTFVVDGSPWSVTVDVVPCESDDSPTTSTPTTSTPTTTPTSTPTTTTAPPIEPDTPPETTPPTTTVTTTTSCDYDGPCSTPTLPPVDQNEPPATTVPTETDAPQRLPETGVTVRDLLLVGLGLVTFGALVAAAARRLAR